jgi:hypothetical protein
MDPRKRQKKLAKKAAKRKAALEKKKRVNLLGWISHGSSIIQAVNSPIYEVMMPRNLCETGLGSVLFSRKMPNGDIGVSVFLVDTFCLGVKSAFFRILSKWEYQNFVADIKNRESLISIQPSCARKLVEESVAYARDLGFSPDKDYHLAQKIFGDVDASACTTEFTFGKDSKPFFVSGPYDNPAKCRRIIATLTERLGPDGFHFMLGGPDGYEFDDDYDEDYEEDNDDYEEDDDDRKQ